MEYQLLQYRQPAELVKEPIVRNRIVRVDMSISRDKTELEAA